MATGEGVRSEVAGQAQGQGRDAHERVRSAAAAAVCVRVRRPHACVLRALPQRHGPHAPPQPPPPAGLRPLLRGRRPLPAPGQRHQE